MVRLGHCEERMPNSHPMALMPLDSECCYATINPFLSKRLTVFYTAHFPGSLSLSLFGYLIAFLTVIVYLWICASCGFDPVSNVYLSLVHFNLLV